MPSGLRAEDDAKALRIAAKERLRRMTTCQRLPEDLR